MNRDLELLTGLERQAYKRMRELIPDLHLPAAQRKPLTPPQDRAVAAYERARAQVRRAHQRRHPADLTVGSLPQLQR